MAERASIIEQVQIGPEDSLGSGGTADTRLRSIGIEPGIQVSLQSYVAKGGKFLVATALGKEWVQASTPGFADYNELVYPFNSIFHGTTPSAAGTSASATTHAWLFQPSHNAADTPKTFYVETGQAARAQSFNGGLWTEFTISFDRDKVEVSGTMLGQAIADGITLEASPAVVTSQPIVPTQVDVYLDGTSGNIGTTKLTRVLSGEFAVSNRYGPVWTVNSAAAAYAAAVELEPTVQIKLMVAADSNGMALLTALRTGSAQYVRLKATGGTIAGTGTYLMQADMAVKWNEVGEYSDDDGVYAIEFTGSAFHDSAWGKAFSVLLQNVVSAL
ncbi:MAG: hypothetical protein HY689_00210 [Chloroflexi bacterium]|nr:hypothetical protein [Chloroflexota bacterium]